MNFFSWVLCKIRGVFQTYWRRAKTDEQISDAANFFISTGSLSQSRAEAVLPSVASEDVSHLLHLSHGRTIRHEVSEERNYLPNAKVDWVVNIDLPPNTVLENSAIAEVFDRQWFATNGSPTLFGQRPDTKRWTFVNSGDAPNSYSRLKFGWKLRPMRQEEANVKQPFVRYRIAVEKAVASWQATVRTEGSPKEAEFRASALIELASACDRSAVVVLQAVGGQCFQGTAIWDVMLCLGLRWGDMDLFHWDNPGLPGHDHLFSVWTSTLPGYFLPEEIGIRLRADLA